MTGVRGKLLVLFVIPLILYVVMLNVMPLMEPDESRYSAIASAMNKSGDYIVPRLKEAVYIEKPPLAYWATALSFKIFGENDFSSRLFAGLCAWGCLLIVYAMGRYWHDEKTGLYGAAVLATSLFHFVIGRLNILDMPVAFLMSLAIWSGYRYCGNRIVIPARHPGENRGGIQSWIPDQVRNDGRGRQGKKAWLYLFYFACALAFLTKGLIGFVLPAAVLVIWLLTVKRWREIHKLVSPLGMAIFLAMVLPWLILIQQAHSDFFRFFFIQEHLQRYTTTIHQHYEPVYYYLPVIIIGTLPWCAFLFTALRGRGAAWLREALFRKEEALFLLVWAGFIVFFFSLSSSKLPTYIGAVFLPLAAAQGRIFRLYDEEAAIPGENGLSRYHLPLILPSLVFIALLLAPVFLKRNNIPLALWWPWIVIPLLLQIVLLFLPGYVRQKTGGHWFLTVYLTMALFFAALLFPISRFLTPYKSASLLIPAISQHVPAGQELYQYGVSLYGIDFYGKMRTPLVDDIGEVLYGSRYLPDGERRQYFLSSGEFFELVKRRPVIYCVTKKQGNVERLRREFPRLTLLWNNGYYYLLKVKSEDS